jgi:ribosome-binding factor A
VSKRRNQLNASIQRAIQQVIGKGLNDPRIRGLITVTHVDLQEDLRTARVNISVLPEEREDLTMHGLKASARHIRHEIGDMINMSKAPDLVFRLDKSLKVQANVISTINKELDDIRSNEEDSSDQDPTPSEGSTA